jgi:hypothetical protein
MWNLSATFSTDGATTFAQEACDEVLFLTMQNFYTGHVSRNDQRQIWNTN